MTKILADQSLRTMLHGLNEHVEIHDDAGKTLGHYVPSSLYNLLLYAWAKAQFADEEELQQAKGEPGGLTTAEVLAHLRGLVGPEKNGA